MRRIATIALSTVLATACVGGSKEVNETDKARLASLILDKEPAIDHKREINFDNKIRLLGYKTEPKGAVRPGQKVKVPMYWKVDKALGEEGWNLFTHVLDGAGGGFCHTRRQPNGPAVGNKHPMNPGRGSRSENGPEILRILHSVKSQEKPRLLLLRGILQDLIL